ncbi:MAG: Txe/YoeB family addiction module toxin [Streptococcaceae bacterium]|nr:Txe/YoeB family addiction module toxin [Streptococcaceae bacterium]
MIKAFSSSAWNDYLYWQTQDKKTLRKLNELIKSIDRDPFSGIGKPEPLREDLSGKWSRRIDEKNRIIYSIDETTIYIFSCKDHF